MSPRDFYFISLENVSFDAGSANWCHSFFKLFILKSNCCLIFKYFVDFALVRFIKKSIVLVQVVLVREGTFQRAYEAEHAAVTINCALAGIWKVLSASLDAVFGEVLSFLLFKTVWRENLQEHIFFFGFPLNFSFSNFLIDSLVFKIGDLQFQSRQQFRVLQLLGWKLLAKLEDFLYSISVFIISALDYRIQFRVIFCFGLRKIKVDGAVEIIVKSLIRL